MRECIYIVQDRNLHPIPLDELNESYPTQEGKDKFLKTFENVFTDGEEAQKCVNKKELEYWQLRKASLEEQVKFAQTEIERYEKLNG